MAKFEPGARVRWNSAGGEAHGRIVRELIEPTRIKGHKVAAGPDNPEFLVESDEGGRAAHKPGALRRERD